MTNIPGAYRLLLCNQTLDLLPQRAIYWREEQTLIVADIHLGKAQTFQRAGLAVPGVTLHHDLARLEDLMVMTSAQRLLVLGDFVHHRSGLTDAVREILYQWCSRFNGELVVILGNHDRPNRQLLTGLPLVLQDKSWRCGPFEFAHEHIAKDLFCFLGHLHPVMSFGSALRLPVYAFYSHYCVLPAFSYFTGGWEIDRGELKQTFALIEDKSVIPIETLVF